MQNCICGNPKDSRSKQCSECYLSSKRAKDDKHCNGCNRTLPLDSFGRRKNKIRSRCRECETAYSRNNRLANMDRVREWKREAYRNQDPVKKTRESIRRSAKSLGFDPEFILKEFEEHLGLCPICMRHPMDIGTHYTRLVIDHNHSINGADSYRGLICNECNQMLGKARDDISTLENAIRYLKGELNGKPTL